MTTNDTITTTSTSKAAGSAQSYIFDNFCELMTRVFMALEEEEWAENAGWDIAFGQSVSDAETAWKLVAAQADAVSAVQPLSGNDLLLHRMAGLISRAVSAPSIAALEWVQARAIYSVAQAPTHIAMAVCDLAHEAQLSIDQMVENAHANGPYERRDSGISLAS